MTPTSSTPVAARTITIALIGNPNTGKSTLFNALTGGRARIGNYPGVTVEKKLGKFRHDGQDVQLVDLPGTYSLAPRSADEMVSVNVLLGRQAEVGQPDAVVCIVDATNLERNLYLFSQIRDLGLPTLLVLNMWDVAEKRGVKIDLAALSQRVGTPVIATCAHRGTGVQPLKDAILKLAGGTVSPPEKTLPDAFYAESRKLGDWLAAKGHQGVPEFLLERMLLDVHGESEHQAALKTKGNVSEYLGEARKRLAAQGCTTPLAETRSRYDWIRRKLDGVVQRTIPLEQATPSDRLDRVLTHRVWGTLFFALLMFLIFQTIYAWAGPFMDAIEAGQGMAADWVSGLMGPGALRSLLVDGIIAGVGSVVIFLPQIVLLFLFIALMEDCGYMARAAFVMDKLMTRVGLSGKSFLPLMSSFACAIPGVMATRVIENPRDRMTTMMVAPLMSCSARLPVYLLMIGTFIPATRYLGGWVGLQEITLFAMYSLGALVAIPIAWLLKKTLFKGETPPFVMELPPYRWPSGKVVFFRVWERAQAFLYRAGSLIFVVTILIWAAGYFPGDHTELWKVQSQIEGFDVPEAAEGEEVETPVELAALQEQERQLSGELLRTSYLGRAGHFVEPVVKPLGWDWRIGVGAIASFPAREVIIATLGTIFSLGGDVDEESEGLHGALQAATWPDGRPLITIPVAFSIMVFFALCAQCAATLMVMRRETNSWRWPIFAFVYMTALAYAGAWLVYRVGTSLSG